MEVVIPEDVEFPLDLPWRLACQLVVYARIHNLTFNQAVARCLAAKLHEQGDLTLEEIADMASDLGLKARIELVPKEEHA